MRGRLILALAFVGLWSAAVAQRHWQLQIRDHEDYRKRAEEQHHGRVRLEPPRGSIFDARGRKLALSVDSDSVWAEPSRLQDRRQAASRLARVLGVDAEALYRRLSERRSFVWVARQLDEPEAQAVRELELEGIHFLKESKRYYPMRSLAAQLIGFAGRDNRGLEGLELHYNSVVAGRAAERKLLRDARRGTVLLPSLAFRDAVAGSDLHLTLDAWIQFVLEEELARGVLENGAKGGVGVVLDTSTGAVLAMSSYPGYDPNHFDRAPAARRRNRAVTDVFEPGSTFKVITAAAALENNLLDPSDEMDCGMGKVVVDGVVIRDHRPFPVLSFREVIAKSSNVCAVKTGQLVGRERFHRQIEAFGFGRPTGIDLPGEEGGSLRSPENWPRRATAYISFGQAISVNALQMASAFAAVANGGTLYRPFVVERISGRRERRSHPLAIGQPISAATARTLGRMLEGVVEEGTGGRAAVPGYRVAGKTGTAQKAVPGKGYEDGRYVASFVGFAPSRRPAIAALVSLDEPDPEKGYHGGDVAAPVFSAIAQQVLPYLGVTPERESFDRWPGESPAAAEPGVLMAAAAVEPGAAARAEIPEGSIPDLSGLTARQALVRSASLGLTVRLHGIGHVRRQEPGPGAPVERAAGGLELWLEHGGAR